MREQALEKKQNPGLRFPISDGLSQGDRLEQAKEHRRNAENNVPDRRGPTEPWPHPLGS